MRSRHPTDLPGRGFSRPRGAVRAGSGSRATAIAAGMLAALFAAGCASQSAGTRLATVQGCARSAVYAIDQHRPVTRALAACRGLSKAELNQAAATAITTIVEGRSPKALRRRLAAEVAPLVARLITAVGPAPSVPRRAYPQATGVPPGEGTSNAGISWAALGAWLAAAGSGGYLLGSWFIRRGTRRRGAAQTGAPPAVLIGHFGLAGAGLVGWICYLAAGWAALAWVSAGLLLPVAGLGMALVTLGLPGYLAGSAPVPGREPAGRTGGHGRAPVLLIAGHGLLAASTVLLVVIAAVGAGRG
jgi:hypothetical protein